MTPTFYQPQINPTLYGLNVPYNQGYDAVAYRNIPTADQIGASGYFRRPDGSQINLWITDLSADFSISGQVAQSRMLREFFPRSFNDVTLTITGNTSSTYELNRLAAFVREHHWEALHYVNAGGTADQTIAFHLDDMTPAAWGPSPNNVKGSHRPWDVTGYIQSIAAGARAHEIAPEFQINFIVATSQLTANTGIWSDSAAVPTHLQTILQFVNAEKAASGGKDFIQPPKPASSSSSSTKTSGADQSNQSLWSTQVAQAVGGLVLRSAAGALQFTI